MKKRLLAGLVGGLMLLSSGVVLAQYMPPPHERQAEKNYNIQSRINAQENLIRRGARTGDLNRREVSILRDNLNRIKRDYRVSKRDGRIDRNEMARLSEMLDRNDHMIRRM
ncbi:MAG: hypothetical protein VB032_10075, partial [Burkholderiaceae bacterium]|nr:hypothetical protein [Burkholderiaceae bacterium]